MALVAAFFLVMGFFLGTSFFLVMGFFDRLGAVATSPTLTASSPFPAAHLLPHRPSPSRDTWRGCTWGSMFLAVPACGTGGLELLGRLLDAQRSSCRGCA
jgi:hypothetical protein